MQYFRFTLSLFALIAVSATAAQEDLERAVGISELCTVCNDVVRCERSADASVDGPPLVIYNLLEDSFWQQIATIWDYLVQYISPKTDDVRAMTVYEFASVDSKTPRVIPDQQATVDAATLTIRLPDSQIDQVSGRWLRAGPGGVELMLGQCELLDFAAGRALLAGLSVNEPGDTTQ
jgi:hypothetical protein